MKRLGKIAVCLAGGLMLNLSIPAQDAIALNNPYGPIVVRNVFGLNPPGPAAPVVEGDPPPKITPNGIMSIFGQLQVLFKVAPKAGQPGAKEESYVLSEGQGQDDIEVSHINEKAGIVTFNNHGTIQEIPLANAPALTTPAPGGMVPGQNIPTPGGISPRFGGRPGGGPGGRFGGQGGGAGSGPALNSVPTRSSSQTNPLEQGGLRSMSADDQELMVVANKLKAQQEGDPTVAIFPPTSLDEAAGVPSNLAPPPTP